MDDTKIINAFSKLHTKNHYYPWMDFHMITPTITRFYRSDFKIEEIKNSKVQLIISNRILPFSNNTLTIPSNHMVQKTIYQFITWLYELSRN